MKIFGSNQDDTLSGTRKSDIIYGNDGDDYIGAHGIEILTGVAREEVYGGAGDDSIGGFSLNLAKTSAPSRGSIVNGGDGTDSLFMGITGKQAMLARVDLYMTIDKIEERFYSVTGSHNQKITGSNQKETIVTDDTDKIIKGRGGNDYIFAQGGDDQIDGGDGNDFIHAGNGHNSLTGGTGDDYFHFYFEDIVEEYTTISDFDVGKDKIVLQIRGPNVTDDDYVLDNESPGFELHQFVNFEDGREIDRDDFTTNQTFYDNNVVYESETGSILLAGVLIAHIEGDKVLTSDDFLISFVA